MKVLHNEEGFVLVTGLMILVVLTLLGIAATTNTSIELQIAGNDRLHKETFYNAEAGAILGTEIMELNFNCIAGFPPTGGNPWSENASIRVYERDKERGDPAKGTNSIILSYNLDFTDDNLDPTHADYYVGNFSEADVILPYRAAGPDANIDGAGQPVDAPDTTYLYIAGGSRLIPGGNINIWSGYEREGKSGAGGGVAKVMDIYSQRRGPLGSESFILLGWTHFARNLNPVCDFP